MKRISTFLGIMLVSSFGMVQAQQKLSDNPTGRTEKRMIRCYTTQAIDAARAKNPFAETDAQFETWMSGQVAKRKAARTALVNYTLPIIFHIISQGEAVGTSPNIAASVVQAQIMMLNQAYSNQAGSPYSVAANTGLQFALAQKNAAGGTLSEPGIDRINATAKGWSDYTTTSWTQAYIDGTVKPASYWDPTKYINVWVMPDIASGTLVGYATFPTSSGLTGISSTETAATAGVAIITSSIGSSYTKALTSNACDAGNPYATGKSLVHELGHFFGLRHIWGDATCGTDYCNDTPTSEDANYGVYYHPKANSCGTADEMFENYMDYTDDVVLNTFTADQTTRIQTVMANSPRRNTLASSTGGFVPVVGTNNVAFIDYCLDSTDVIETGTKSVGNQYYRDIYVNVGTENFATDAGVVSFTYGGTAVNGVDYDVIPSTVTFAAGEATKSVVLRIYDNAAVDGDRKIILGLNISGPGISVGPAHQTFSVNILDDDDVKIGQNKIKFVNEGFETGAIGWTVRKTAAPYLNTFTVSANATAGTGLGAHVTNDATNKPNVYSRGTAGVTYLVSPVINPFSVQSLDSLSFKYKIRGRGTVSSPTDYGLMLYSINDGNLYYWGSTASLTGRGPYCTNSTTAISNTPRILAPTALAAKKFQLVFYFRTGAVTTGGDPGLNIDDVALTAIPYPIETTVSSSYGFTVPALKLNNFRSVNNKQIIAINNPTVDVNGVVASVSEAGTDRVVVGTEATGTFYRSRKVITVTPVAASANAAFTATIYFTQAEIAAWGTERNSVQIIQVDDASLFNGVLNPSNAKLIIPTVIDNLATDGYIAYTFNATGFGSFAIVSQAALLPLKLISFTGALKNDISNLKWNTTNEKTVKGFDVERSRNGVTYAAVGFVKALNGSNNEYAFNDTKIEKGNKYYYRLKMIDVDGKFTYSDVVVITYVDKNKWYTVYPSPVTDVLFIQNNNTTSQNAEVVISEVSGKVVYKHTGAIAGKLEVPVKTWAAGTYIVKIKSNEIETTMKVVKQ